MAARTAVGGKTAGPMLTAPPAERAPGMFRGGLPVQDLVGTALRELELSMLDANTAIRLGANSSRPRYFGTVLPAPTKQWLSPSDVNTEDQVRAAVVNGGNAPTMANKRAAQGAELDEGPRVARGLPQRRR